MRLVLLCASYADISRLESISRHGPQSDRDSTGKENALENGHILICILTSYHNKHELKVVVNTAFLAENFKTAKGAGAYYSNEITIPKGISNGAVPAINLIYSFKITWPEYIASEFVERKFKDLEKAFQDAGISYVAEPPVCQLMQQRSPKY